MKTKQEIIKVNSIDNSTYVGFKLNHQRELPKSAKIYKCGTEIETLNDFNIYKKVSKKEIKFYIIFSKYF